MVYLPYFQIVFAMFKEQQIKTAARAGRALKSTSTIHTHSRRMPKYARSVTVHRIFGNIYEDMLTSDAQLSDVFWYCSCLIATGIEVSWTAKIFCQPDDAVR